MEKQIFYTGENPIIYSDFPDPDIIRVGDVYYMASTTMHFMPGCDILRSHNLLYWELLAHAYDTLEEEDPRYFLEEEQNVYGKGMWAPSFRCHEGLFYILFTSNDTHKTHLLTAERPEGPWKKSEVDGWYYDSGLFFDDDGKVYIVHGQKTLYLTQMKTDLSGPELHGLHRVIARDREDADLGYEGSHMYKKDGRYYVFTCHMHHGNRKSEDCFVADSLEGEFKGRCIIDDDMGYHDLGVAQGGMVDTPQGDWYLFMFQDRGALGRAPILLPMQFDGAFPAISNGGKVPPAVSVPAVSQKHSYAPLNGSDDFSQAQLRLFWQFNHQPKKGGWSLTQRPGHFRIRTLKCSQTIFQAQNTLTQRMIGPSCAGEVTLDGTGLKDGDAAGLAAFIGNYGWIGISREMGKNYLVRLGRPAKDETIYGDADYAAPGVECGRVEIGDGVVRLRVEADFEDKRDEASFYFWKDGAWRKLGSSQKTYFKMDLFTGCRFGLFCFSRQAPGGIADFSDFRFFDDKKKGRKEDEI